MLKSRGLFQRSRGLLQQKSLGCFVAAEEPGGVAEEPRVAIEPRVINEPGVVAQEPGVTNEQGVVAEDPEVAKKLGVIVCMHIDRIPSSSTSNHQLKTRTKNAF